MKFPKLNGKAVLSPMYGITDVAFRALAKKYGAALTYTEFVGSTSLVRGSQVAWGMLKADSTEQPVAVQLFGHNEEDVVKAAQEVQEKFDIIDINCGCPAWNVIKAGAGSELLKQPEKIAGFVSKLVAAVRKPVTVKIRIGIDDRNINAVEVAKLVEKAGAAAIAIHGRTQKQGYTCAANWDIIKKVKSAVSIPVIGNGDVFTPEQFKKRLEESGVDAIMIARGAIGNPYVFKQIEDYLQTGKYEKADPIELFFEYLELAKKHSIQFNKIKGHSIQFTKGIIRGSDLRQKLAQCETIEQIEDVLKPKILAKDI
ncbi:MAG: tRNA dihydrouridine synthase DusB [Candidatus Woesearchaeota archaeon]